MAYSCGDVCCMGGVAACFMLFTKYNVALLCSTSYCCMQSVGKYGTFTPIMPNSRRLNIGYCVRRVYEYENCRMVSLEPDATCTRDTVTAVGAQMPVTPTLVHRHAHRPYPTVYSGYIILITVEGDACCSSVWREHCCVVLSILVPISIEHPAGLSCRARRKAALMRRTESGYTGSISTLTCRTLA